MVVAHVIKESALSPNPSFFSFVRDFDGPGVGLGLDNLHMDAHFTLLKEYLTRPGDQQCQAQRLVFCP